MYARGKQCRVSKHAHEGMQAERPPIDYGAVQFVLEEPSADDGTRATRRVGRRTILVYYNEFDDEILIRSVSTTRSSLGT